jgi:hypothetical protein
MKNLIAWPFAIALLLAPLLASAELKDCDELKDEIEAKIKNNGVKSFKLTIVGKSDVAEGEQVGSCEGGTKKIMYVKG